MKQQSKVITAHVPLPLADKVDQLAARIERSRGWIIKQASIGLAFPAATAR